MSKAACLALVGLLAAVPVMAQPHPTPPKPFTVYTAQKSPVATALRLGAGSAFLGAHVRPEAAGSVTVRQVEELDLTAFSNAELTAFAEQDVDAHSVDRMLVQSVCFEYGVSDSFTLGARLPYVARHDVR